MTKVLIRGLVDGALSSLGVVIGAAVSNNLEVILSAGLSGAVANGFSNILAAFTAEKTGSYKHMRNLERSLLSSLKGTNFEQRLAEQVRKAGFYDGLFSFIGGLTPILPFVLLDITPALITAIGLVSIIAAFLGVYTSHFSRENVYWSVIKLVTFTLLTAGLCSLIQFVIL